MLGGRREQPTGLAFGDTIGQERDPERVPPRKGSHWQTDRQSLRRHDFWDQDREGGSRPRHQLAGP